MHKRSALPLCLFALLLILILVILPRHNAPVASSGGATFVTSWGSDVTSISKFNKPLGVAVDSAGNVYVADTRNHRIQKFNAAGTFVTSWGGYGSADGQFNLPSDVGVDLLGRVYVADTGNQRIQAFIPCSTPADTSDATISCFIATAAYGSYLDPHVQVLRDFRDRVLAPTRVGRAFLDLYYAWSPPAAQFIAQHEGLRLAARWALTPLVYVIQYPGLLGFLIVPAVALAVRTGRKRARC